MTTRITARAAGYEEDGDDEVIEAGFSENEDGSGFALLIQRTDYEPNQDEVDLGWDTYCLTTGDGLTHYGGLLEVRLVGRTMGMKISPGAAEVLRVDEELEVTFEVNRESIERFRNGLPGIVRWGREEQRPQISGF